MPGASALSSRRIFPSVVLFFKKYLGLTLGAANGPESLAAA
jgi:hypothetical protein